MDSANFTDIQKVALWIVPIIFAVTLHEAAHGYIALRFGDDTALKLGRITLNPLKHIDLMGTIIIPVVLMLSTGFIFGWAKPVPVNASRLHHPKRDMAWVALAGPMANFVMALFWGLVFKLSIYLYQQKIGASIPLSYMAQAGISINLVLMVLNLIPIPPLDGSRMITSILPRPWDAYYNKLPPLVGFFIILALIWTGLLGKLLGPAVTWLQNLMFKIYFIPIVI